MLRIRLARGGAKKRPYYHIVVAEKPFARDGRFVERLGASNPTASGKSVVFSIDMPRYERWIAQGAQPTLTVQRLIRAKLRADAGKPPRKSRKKANKKAAAAAEAAK
jgi:small subunit ribosomal protein S16